MHTAVVIADGQIHQKRIVMEKYGAQGTMHTIINMKVLQDAVDTLLESKGGSQKKLFNTLTEKNGKKRL